MTMTPEERFDRLDDFIARGAILRGKWKGKDVRDGRELACLLAALSPEAGEKESAAACPADTIPMWLAHMLPMMDDSGSLKAWPSMIRRVASTLRRCHRWLQPDDWRRSDYATRAVALREALPTLNNNGRAQASTKKVLTLCEREARGESVSTAEWSEARDGSITCPYSAASFPAASGAAYAAYYAVKAPTSTGAPRSIYVQREVWDRISTATLDILDAACAAREAQH